MRSQIVITINAEVAREKYESHEELAIRIDKALTIKINEWQNKPAYKNWYLLSVVQTGGEFPTGFFTTTWEYDTESQEDSETPVSMDTGYFEINSECGQGCCNNNQDSVAEDGDTSPHVRYGEVIRVNDVRFQLVSFDQGAAGATVTFVEESKANQFLRPEVDAGIYYPRSRYGR